MQDQNDFIWQMGMVAKNVGLGDITPHVLSDAGNLILHLAPYPIVARIAVLASQLDQEQAKKLLCLELGVARHLHNKGVGVLLPTDLIDAGPHWGGGAWMTFWHYVVPTKLAPLLPAEGIQLVNGLAVGLRDFSEELPKLGVWNKACTSALRLRNEGDKRIQDLLTLFFSLDEQMRSMELVPSHGDAHVRNLLPSPQGRLWMDFEDVSLMPPYWDLASFVGNLVLFKGFQEPTFRYLMDFTQLVTDQKAFRLALGARTLMSTLGNLDLALAGHGDLVFAQRQLACAQGFLVELDLARGGKTLTI